MMQAKSIIHGFELIKSVEIKEISSTYLQFKHQKSGADLIFLKNEDNNKVFNITFRTIPEDDTGCPHILEHSVLNGSKRYPAKGTFMELIKGSLKTFLNAMTSSDWTTYPIASTNDKDYINLMRVYLDAVLNPLIYEDPRILQQEGWHYELFEPQGEINYRGVVYNEMKGAFSSVDSILVRTSSNAQFPDTPYGFESGGDPDAIPQLTQEKFTAFHQKYYHPSNSLIWLYGNINLEETLKIIDEEYLNSFDDPKVKISFPMQEPFAKPIKRVEAYPIADDQEAEGQYHLVLNYTYGKMTDPYLTDTLSLLSELLMNTPASPLKAKIRDSGLCKHSMIYARTDMLQPTLHIICKQIKKEDLEKLSELIHTEMQRIVKEGFDKKMIEAAVNSREFFLREAQMQGFPKGLFYNLSAIYYWNHYGQPEEAIAFEETLAHLRRGLSEPIFEELLEKFCLENTHKSEVHFEPHPGLIAKQDERVKEELAAYKKSLSDEQIQELIKLNEELKNWQEEPDSEEELLKIPLLSLDDIDPKALKAPTIVEKHDNFELLKLPVATNGINYFRIYFDLAQASKEEMQYLKLYTQLLGQINSQNFSYGDLANEIRNFTGGISLNLSIFGDTVQSGKMHAKLILSGKALAAKTDKLVELMAEYAMRAIFDEPARLKSLIHELRASTEEDVISRGNTVAINRMLATFSRPSAYNDAVSGLDYLYFLNELSAQMEGDLTPIIEKLKALQGKFFNQNNSLITITADEELIEPAFSSLKQLCALLSKEAVKPFDDGFTPTKLNEGIPAPIKIQYVVKGGSFIEKGYPYSGKMLVLANILNTEFLYKELRVKGGAYGGGAGFRQDGTAFFYSYRDPNLVESLNTYDAVASFMRTFTTDEREMLKYILGVISNLDYPKTPESLAADEAYNHLAGISFATVQQIRDEVLSTTVADIQSYADLIESITAENRFVVVGNEAKIKESAQLFDKISPVFKK